MTEKAAQIGNAPSPRFRRYPQYRDSGIEWLGEIPAHWDSKRLKFVAQTVAGQSPPSAAVADGMDGLPFLQGNAEFGLLNPTPHQVCNSAPKRAESGDILISVRAPVGAMNMADQQYGIGRGLCAIRPTPQLNRSFGFYQITATRRLLDAVATGSTYSAVTASDIGDLLTLLPCEDEQRAIADFLDRETAKIDALVAKKERLIELLQEKRTALITHAVTRGLDPNVSVKDSGVEWLGEIPAHWQTLSLGRVTISRCDGPFGSGLKSEHYSESGVRVVRLQNIGWAEFMNSDAAYLDEAYARRLGDHTVKREDILMAGLGDDGHPVGRACVAPIEIEPAMVKADCFRFRLDQQRVFPRYAALQLSATASAVAGHHATGATRARVNLATSAKRMVALPPLSEQQAIATFLDRETSHIDTLITKIRQAIDHLTEYRIALISAAVTGRIDVRKEAA